MVKKAKVIKLLSEEQRTPLYNNYGVLTHEAQQLAMDFGDVLSEFLSTRDNIYRLHEMEGVLVSELGAQIAEKKLRQARMLRLAGVRHERSKIACETIDGGSTTTS